jgi:lambda family phage tail tape measure protein
MASEIIKELYRVLVVKKAVAAISTAFGFADGGVISNGSQVQAYADGGVVSSPTTFGMSGGKTGLMGEAGPEAIMPLKRGANGKLGVQMEGGGATTVVQNFNFSANGDDSVKRIIAQAAPKIAEMTKSQIVNDRKRGGSMKAAFG